MSLYCNHKNMLRYCRRCGSLIHNKVTPQLRSEGIIQKRRLMLSDHNASSPGFETSCGKNYYPRATLVVQKSRCLNTFQKMFLWSYNLIYYDFYWDWSICIRLHLIVNIYTHSTFSLSYSP